MEDRKFRYTHTAALYKYVRPRGRYGDCSTIRRRRRRCHEL